MKSLTVAGAICLVAWGTTVHAADAAESEAADACNRFINCFLSGGRVAPYSTPYTEEYIDTTFRLYTRRLPNYSADFRHMKVGSVQTFARTDYNGNKTTYFLTHGFLGSHGMKWIVDFKDALLLKEDSNVFLVDWNKGAGLNWAVWKLYDQAASNTRVVGATIAKFAVELVKSHGSDPSRMHAIGFSLGAHVMGVFGKNMPGLARLTGLDPARPCFEIEGNDDLQLMSTDALLMDVVHTTHNSANIMHLGYKNPVGHVDFFLNSEMGHQPGCPATRCDPAVNGSCPDMEVDMEMDVANNCGKVPLVDFNQCSHAYSHKLYTASLGLEGQAWSCVEYASNEQRGCVPFGYNVFSVSERGNYELKSFAKPPYLLVETKP